LQLSYDHFPGFWGAEAQARADVTLWNHPVPGKGSLVCQKKRRWTTLDWHGKERAIPKNWRRPQWRERAPWKGMHGSHRRPRFRKKSPDHYSLSRTGTVAAAGFPLPEPLSIWGSLFMKRRRLAFDSIDAPGSLRVQRKQFSMAHTQARDTGASIHATPYPGTMAESKAQGSTS